MHTWSVQHAGLNPGCCPRRRTCIASSGQMPPAGMPKSLADMRREKEQQQQQRSPAKALVSKPASPPAPQPPPQPPLQPATLPGRAVLHHSRAATDDVPSGPQGTFRPQGERVKKPLDVLEQAGKIISRGPISVQGLRLKLEAKGHSAEEAQGACDTLVNKGLMDDQLFAKHYVQSKWLLSHKGKSVLLQELKKKGIDQSIAFAAVNAFFAGAVQEPNEDETEEEEESNAKSKAQWAEDHGTHGLGQKSNFTQQDMVQQLLIATNSRLAGMVSLPKETQRRRSSAWLLRRGHSWGTVRVVLDLAGLWF